MRILTFVMLLVGSTAMAQERPPLPYEAAGVCPLECCMYHQWESTASIPVYEQRNETSTPLFQLKKVSKFTH